MRAATTVWMPEAVGYRGEMQGAAPDPSTLGLIDLDAKRQHRLAVRGRRVPRATVAVLVAFVGAGLLGGLGYRSASQDVTQRSVRVVLERPAVTRGGLPTRWRLTVATTDGTPLDGPVVVETTSAYFDLFDHNDLVPEPDATWQGSGTTLWEYRPDGEPSLEVSLDVRTQPDVRWRRSALTTVVVGGERVAELEYHTWVLP